MTANKTGKVDRDDPIGEPGFEPLHTVRQTAMILNISERQVWREIDRGALAVVRLGPKMVRIEPREIRRYVTQRRS